VAVVDRLKNLVRLLRNTDGARREAFRTHVFHQAGRVTPFLGVEHDGVRYVLSTRESGGVAFPTFIFGFFDEEVVGRMRQALSLHAGIATLDGLTVLDVGANIGTETVSLLMRHGVERVIAIEPDPENVRFLKANLALNGVDDRVTIRQIALSDVDGTVELERSESNWGDHRIRVNQPAGRDLRGESQRASAEVPACRLDTLVDTGEINVDDLDLVWMDAQGHEGHILAGAGSLAASRIPIVTEYWPYGLRRAGGLERFHALVKQHYDVVVDLREPHVALDAGRVSELADRYVAENGDPFAAHTDVLLLPRWPSSDASNIVNRRTD
jgi:FkbM family methyltransferase